MESDAPIPRVPDELISQFARIDSEFLEKSRKRLESERIESSKLLENLEKDRFLLQKDLLLFVGSVFGSSIALASGRDVNGFFVIGEFFLFIAVISALVNLHRYLSSQDFFFAFDSKNSLSSFLISNASKIDETERKMYEEARDSYDALIKSNQSGLLYTLLKRIPLEKWIRIFYACFIIGMLFILFSIIPISRSKSIDLDLISGKSQSEFSKMNDKP